MHGYKYDNIEVKNIFEDFKRRSRNFSILSPKIIRSNPRILLLLRLYLNLNQIEFSNLIGKAKSTVSYYENGKTSPTMKSANKIFNILISDINFPLNLDLILSRFQKQHKKSKGFSDRKRAIELAYKSNKNWKRKQEIGVELLKKSKRTEQEIMIENTLRNYNINFISQAVLLLGKSKAGAIVTDFLIDSKKKIIIEATDDYLDYKFPKKCKRRAMIIAYRGFRIKKYFPHYYTIAFLSQQKLHEKVIHILKESYNSVVLNNDVKKLIQIIKC